MASDPREREACVVRRLRTAVAFVVVIGVGTIVLGYTDVVVTELDYQQHVERAGSDELTGFVLLLLLPGAWVYRRPRWRPIVVWIVWVAIWLVPTALVGLDAGEYEMVSPMWVRALIFMLLAAIGGTVAVLLPLVRSTHKSPAIEEPRRAPSARVVRS